MGKRKVFYDNPLVSTKHRRTTLVMLAEITKELKTVYGSGWNRDDTVVLLALRAGFAHHAPATPTQEKLNHEQ